MSIDLCPRPLRDIVFNPLKIWCLGNQPSTGYQELDATFNFVNAQSVIPLAKDTIKATIRTALAILGVCTVYKVGGFFPVAAIAFSAVSLPSVLIAGGTWAVGSGFLQAMTAVSSGALASGAAMIAGGMFALEFHDLLEMGSLEWSIKKFAKKLAPDFVNLLV